MMTHALASTMLTETLTDFPSVSGHFTHCWAFRSVLRVVNSIIVAVPIYSISDLYANSRDSHCENGSFEVLSLHFRWSHLFVSQSFCISFSFV